MPSVETSIFASAINVFERSHLIIMSHTVDHSSVDKSASTCNAKPKKSCKNNFRHLGLFNTFWSVLPTWAVININYKIKAWRWHIQRKHGVDKHVRAKRYPRQSLVISFRQPHSMVCTFSWGLPPIYRLQQDWICGEHKGKKRTPGSLAARNNSGALITRAFKPQAPGDPL